jgi:ubiquinone/menaquinone biosynthesis C-methylase UbiE
MLTEYGLPMDEAELERIDMCHVKYCALIGKKKYLAPIGQPQRILDLGCGTGKSFSISLDIWTR